MGGPEKICRRWVPQQFLQSESLRDCSLQFSAKRCLQLQKVPAAAKGACSCKNLLLFPRFANSKLSPQSFFHKSRVLPPQFVESCDISTLPSFLTSSDPQRNRMVLSAITCIRPSHLAGMSRSPQQISVHNIRCCFEATYLKRMRSGFLIQGDVSPLRCRLPCL